MNFKIPPSMAGRKTKLTPERQEKILGCVRAGMSYKDAAQSAGITPETLCRWLARGKVESSLFHEFYESVRKALVHFELVHLDNIERSALGESKIIRQTVVLPPSSVGEMTLRRYSALNYSQNCARDLRCALNGA